MIKGVNRQIIEVSSTENAYFERALLVVRPQYETAEGEKLKKAADRYLASAGDYTALRCAARRRFWVSAGLLTAGAAVGAVIGILLF